MSKEKQIPEIPSLRCPSCGTRMMPGFPLCLISPSGPENLTVCPSCEKAWRYGVEIELAEAKVGLLFGPEKLEVERMIKLCLACQGKGRGTR